MVLCLVADKLCRTVNEEDEHADDPPALRAARYALQRRDTARSSMAPAEEEEEVSPGSPGPSSQPLASLRLVCKSWKDAIDKCLEYLTLFRSASQPLITSLAATPSLIGQSLEENALCHMHATSTIPCDGVLLA